MSVFTKRRKIVRKKKGEQLKQWKENCKRQDKSMQLMIDTAKHIDENHPEFESLNEEERALLFAKIYKELNGTE